MPEAITAIVIDADPGTRRAMSRLLESGGIHAECHSDFGSFQRRKPHQGVMVLVVGIDSAHGQLESVCAKIRNEDGLPPTIYLSNGYSSSMTVEAKRAGAVAYFHKPVDGQALLDAVRFAASGPG